MVLGIERDDLPFASAAGWLDGAGSSWDQPPLLGVMFLFHLTSRRGSG